MSLSCVAAAVHKGQGGSDGLADKQSGDNWQQKGVQAAEEDPGHCHCIISAKTGVELKPGCSCIISSLLAVLKFTRSTILFDMVNELVQANSLELICFGFLTE